MTNKSDAGLIALARAGDRVAFGHLVERYHQMVKRIALNMVRNECLAQDLAQETMLQAYLSLDRLRDDGRFQSWLYGITLNVCKSYIRQQKMDFFSLETIVGGMHVDAVLFSGVMPDPETVVEERDLHRLVMDAVNTLSPKNRNATLLFYYERLTVWEIATLLDISVAAVKGRLYRSRQQLKLELLSLYSEINQVVQTRERRGKMKVTVADIVNQVDILEKSDIDATKDARLAHRIVVLLDEAGRRVLPIWVGPYEGDAIAQALLASSLPRPMTFTFMANLLEAVGSELEAVDIDALKEGVFYATAKIRVGGTVREIDARPSDAINLALCMESPIYVAETVMEAAGVDISKEDALPTGAGLGLLEQRMREPGPEEGERKAERKYYCEGWETEFAGKLIALVLDAEK